MGEQANAKGIGHWSECCNIRVIDDTGQVVYNAPKWLRCQGWGCRRIVTRAQIRTGSCTCGNRRLGPAHQLTEAEIEGLANGEYPLESWEAEMVYGGDGKHEFRA